MRVAAVFGLIFVVAATGCVSRNVESIDREEAAAMEPPPEPLTPEERAAGIPASPGFSGTASVADGATASTDGVLYVIVRVAGRETGPPLAVKRLPVLLPAQFTVTSDDAMIPGTPLVDDMDVVVRVDQDGDAFTTEPGDLVGTATGVSIGDTIEVVLEPVEATP